jgi:hypothetical protein
MRAQRFALPPHGHRVLITKLRGNGCGLSFGAQAIREPSGVDAGQDFEVKRLR